MRRALAVASALAPLLLASACTDATEPDPNVAVRVEIRYYNGPLITAADSLPWYTGFFIDVVALNGRGEPIPDQTVTWTASGAIQRDPTGHAALRATGVGTGTITATVQDKTAQVTIKTYLPASTLVRPWPDTSRMLVGTSRVLVVRTVEQGAPMEPGGSLRWETSDPSIATVDQQGMVTTVGEGHATITAVVSGRRFPAEVFTFRYPAPLRFASVTMASGYSHLGSSDRACGVTTDGALYCWGLSYELMGTDEPTDRCMRVVLFSRVVQGTRVGRCSAVPVPVRPDLRFTSVSSNQYLTCALSVDGVAYCWGTYYTTGSRLPTPIANDLTFRSIDVGAGFQYTASACGVTTSGSAYCWWENDYGQLGTGSTSSSAVPVSVAGGLLFQSVRAGSTSCGITADGATYCWGANDVAQAGAPVGTDTKTPVRVTGDHRFVQVEPAGSLTCGLTETGSVYCWGALGGPAAPSPAPVALSGDVRFARLAEHAPCGVTPEGAVYRWDAALVPTAVALPFPVRLFGRMRGYGYVSGLAASCTGSYALGTDGLLYWWDAVAGRDASTFFYQAGSLPAGLEIGSSIPVLVPGQQ